MIVRGLVGVAVGAVLLLSILELSCVADEGVSATAPRSTLAPASVEPAWPVLSEVDDRALTEGFAYTR